MSRFAAACLLAGLALPGTLRAEEAAPVAPPKAAPDPDALLADARALYHQGFLLAARSQVRSVLRARPGDAEAKALALDIEHALVDQVERSFQRRERPVPEPGGDREAQIAHGRAQARTLAKSGAYTQARAVLEALKAAFPDAAGALAGDLADLERARTEAAARTEASARASEASALERERARVEAETEAAVRRRRDALALAASHCEAGRWGPAEEALRGLPQDDPDAAALRRRASDGRLRDTDEASRAALSRSEALLAEGRFEEARRALGAAASPEAEALRRRISEGEAGANLDAQRRREEAVERSLSEEVASALEQARGGDPRGARAKLYGLRSRHPGNARIAEALREVDALEVPSDPGLAPRLEEAERRRGDADARAARKAVYEEACRLLDGGFLEEARARFARVAETEPGAWEVDRFLSRIDEALRTRTDAAPEGLTERYDLGMARYELGDLAQAEAILQPLAAAEDLNLWRRQRVSRALADIARRRERARTLLVGTGSDRGGGP